MRKKYSKAFSVFICVCMSILVGHAYYQSSIRTISPKFKLNTWCHSSNSNLTSSLATPQSHNVYLAVDGLGSLESSYVSSSSRILELRLMDDDPIGNASDVCKTYKGKFEGRRLVDVVYLNTSSGSIDGTNDSTVEMFLSGRLKGISGDKELPGGTNLFYYIIHID